MSDSANDSLSKTTTFRFASDQILTLTESQIKIIPYLSALVSSADEFESARDEDGYLKLDQNIKYEDFIPVLKLSSFHSIRQLFTHLPKETNIIPIIALFDFLGLHSHPDPTLEEVDLTFFSNVVYNPLQEKYIRLTKPPVMQEMAVRFAIAIFKEEYDFSKDEVIDHIYWLIMFVLSAYKYFGTRLRHHMHTIAENCFSVFRSSQLKSLRRLKEKMDYDAKRRLLGNFEYFEGYTGENFLHSEVIHFDYCNKNNLTIFPRLLRRKLQSRLCSTHEDYYLPRFWSIPETPIDENLLEPVRTRVVEIIYGRLQNQIYQRALPTLRNKTYVASFEPNSDVYKLSNSSCTIKSLIESELVQREIRELVLEELTTLTPKLKQKHIELQQKLQSYSSNGNSHTRHSRNAIFFLWRPFRSDYEICQEEALRYTLLLDKLDHASNIIVEQLQKRVSQSLYDAALNQLWNWLETQQEIDKLRELLAAECSSRNFLAAMSKRTHKRDQVPIPKLMPKHQLKYLKR